MGLKKKFINFLNFFLEKKSYKIVKVSQLELSIPGEINDDVFSKSIKNLASLSSVKNIIEIGSSSGGGSTTSFIEALQRRNDLDEIKFICLELSNIRFKNLKNYLTPYEFAIAYNLSSVDINSFPTENEVIKFYKNRNTVLNKFPLDEVLRWRKQDIDYIKNSGKNICGLEAIKKSLGIKIFDLCLIDGSEFTGKVELNHLIGSNYILLDDTESYKCREAFEILNNRDDYDLIEYNPSLRNGCAAFQKKKRS